MKINYKYCIKRTVMKRLQAMPIQIGFIVGSYGYFSRNQLIDEVDKDSRVGKEIVKMQLNFIRNIPTLLKKV